MLSHEQSEQLQRFFEQSNFAEKGGVITDLDGTAIHEYQGRLLIPEPVEKGLKKIYDLGRPIIINTLRFPISVMKTFGQDWYRMSNAPVPTVLMNGSLLGYMVKGKNNEFGYEEIKAFPLTETEISEIMKLIEELVAAAVLDLLVFYYPRNWQEGEIIWTPSREKISEIQNKYRSAASVVSFETGRLKEELNKTDICMVFMLVDIPQDKLMAYQHTKKSNFFNHIHVNKLSGAVEITNALGIQLAHCLGAGDSEMDTFLTGVGQAVHVGNPHLKFEGLLPPIKLANSMELGDLLYQLAAMQGSVIH